MIARDSRQVAGGEKSRGTNAIRLGREEDENRVGREREQLAGALGMWCLHVIYVKGVSSTPEQVPEVGIRKVFEPDRR